MTSPLLKVAAAGAETLLISAASMQTQPTVVFCSSQTVIFPGISVEWPFPVFDW
jgi:hypothetical protein